MKRTWKFLLLLLSVMMVVGFAGCVKNGKTDITGGEILAPVIANVSLQDGEVFAYDSDGVRIDQDESFVDIEGDTYYAVKNKIVFGMHVIKRSVYNFDENGKMIKNREFGGYTYGKDGKLIAVNIFITINNNIYYIIDNTTAEGLLIIENHIYNFGEDGKMLVGKHGDYTYGEDGKLISTNIFITINNNVYYVINGEIQKGEHIIGDYIYNFGEDGKMWVGKHGDYTYGEDGKLIATNIFITINNNIYYIIGGEIQKGELIINNYVYNFCSDGKMWVGKHGDYTYGEDGKLIATNIFITINNDIYYIIGGEIQKGELIINNYVYNFGSDGKMWVGKHGGYTYGEDGKLIATNIFITINNNIYYIINGETVKSCYKVIETHIYYFGADGKLSSPAGDDYEIGSDGYIVGDYVEIVNEDKTYFVIDDVVYEGQSISGTVYESDNDYDLTNNDVLSNVACSVKVGDRTIAETNSDENGAFAFDNVPASTLILHFDCTGYISTEINVDLATESNINVLMDRNVSNTLKGKVVLADSDLDQSNNTPMSGARVTLVRDNGDEYSNGYSMTTTTNSSGDYSFSGMTAGVYKLVVEKEGYITITQTVQVRYNETTYQNLQLEAIPEVDEDEAGGYASGTIKDARTGLKISADLTIYIREGVNNFVGDALCTITTSDGMYTTPELPAGNYTATVVDERENSELPDGDEDYRYTTQTIAIKVLSGMTISGQDATLSNKIGFTGTGVRIVLNWGATPSDLDSHLTFGSSHVYFSNKKVGNCSLDVDDTTAYGPETITIEEVGSYTYKYYVYNYSGLGTFQAANAVVKVYEGNALLYTFNAPSGAGYYWNIFSIDGETGEFTITNTISSSAL